MVWFPPLYPVMLAILDLVGIRGLEGARVICVVSYTSSTLLVGTLLYTTTASLVLSILDELLFLTMADIVTVHLYTMSEAPFVVLFLLFIFCMLRALEDDRTRWIITAGCTAAAASLTRYTGASIIFTGAITFLWNDDRSSYIRLRRAAIFLIATCAPLSIWMARNVHEAGSLTERHPGFYPLESYQYPLAASTVVRWFIPWLADQTCAAVGGPVMVALILALAILIYWNPQKLVWMLAVFALSNGAFIVASRFFMDPYVVLTGRMLVPILVSLLLLTSLLAYSLVARPTIAAPWRWIVISMAILFIVANAFRSKAVLDESHDHGLELSRAYYRDSALITWLSRLPPGTVLYSDEPEPIYFETGRFAEQLPMITDPESKLPLASTSREIGLLHDRLGDQRGFIVYFNDASAYRRDNMPPIDSMPAVYSLSMREVVSNKEGTIYEMRSTAPVPRQP